MCVGLCVCVLCIHHIVGTKICPHGKARQISWHKNAVPVIIILWQSIFNLHISPSDIFSFPRGQVFDMSCLYPELKWTEYLYFLQNKYFVVRVTVGCLHCCPCWFSKHISVVRRSDLFWKIPGMSVIWTVAVPGSKPLECSSKTCVLTAHL